VISTANIMCGARLGREKNPGDGQTAFDNISTTRRVVRYNTVLIYTLGVGVKIQQIHWWCSYLGM
jgi:hypothetical protein